MQVKESSGIRIVNMLILVGKKVERGAEARELLVAVSREIE